MTSALSPILDHLFSLHRFGIRPGLERIRALAAMLGNPQQSYPIIHIAGTNGKGSACSMLAAILISAGYRVGLYTSPHIRRFNERIKVNGEPISDADVERMIAPLLREAEKEHTTFFEITTAAAFSYFAEKNVDIAVIETGMGGRLDATNIVLPIASVITSIDFDHSEYLGNTLELIAEEKAGIIKPNAPVVIGEPRESLWETFERVANAQKAPIIFAPRRYSVETLHFRADFSMTARIKTPSNTFEDVDCCLAGTAQARNIAAVLGTLDAIAAQFPANEYHVREGLRNTRRLSGLDGRVELLRNTPPIVLDVGHNPACIRNLAQTLSDCGYVGSKWHTVFGVMADKETDEMLAVLSSISERIITAAPNYARALPAKELAERAQLSGAARVCLAESVADAVRLALETDEPVLITGSFYVADEALQYLANAGAAPNSQRQ